MPWLSPQVVDWIHFAGLSTAGEELQTATCNKAILHKPYKATSTARLLQDLCLQESHEELSA